MTTHTRAGGITMNSSRWLAVAIQIGSWFATLWLVQWLWPAAELQYQLIAAVIAECIFIAAKEQLFAGGELWIGWLGLVLDGLINMGGIMPATCRFIGFGPLQLVIRAFSDLPPGAPAPGCSPFDALPVFLALLLGALFSVGPHRLWRAMR